MKLSQFTLVVEDYPNPGEHLIYNTRTQALVKLDQKTKNILDRLGASDFAPDFVEEERLKALYRMGFIVKDQAEDDEKLARFMEQKKYGVSDSKFHATILTTYNCNFACTYCFEESTRTSNQRLDRATSDLILTWLKRKIEKLRMKRLIVDYYGGEPLLNQSAIEYITPALKEWCDARGVRFQMEIQTNGALLTPDFVDKYLPYGLYEVQVSLDGVREVHDANRPMRGSGAGTFDTVVKNLQAVADKVGLIVAAGYDKGDPQPLIDLIDHLDDIGLLKKLKKFIWSPVHPTLGPKGHADQVVSPGCLKNYDTDTLHGAETKIKQALEKKGILMSSGLSASMCAVTSGERGVTIDTQGLIFKCNAMLGHPELAVGDVREEEYNAQRQAFLAAEPWKECDSDCPYMPLCNTGCRLFGLFKKGDFMAKSCEKGYMDKFVPEAIKKEYELQLAAKQKQAKPKEALV